MNSLAEYSNLTQNAKVISCVMERGHAEGVVEALYQKKHVLSIEYSTGRKQHVMSRKEWFEVDMLTAVVSSEYAEEVFSDIYHLAKIANTEGGVMYQTNLLISSTNGLPDLTEMLPELNPNG